MPRSSLFNYKNMSVEEILPAIATIQTNIEYMKKTLEEMRGEQKLASTIYLRLIEFDSYKEESERKLIELDLTIGNVKREYATRDYVKPALTFTYTVLGVFGTAVVGALAAFIIQGGLK